MFWLLLFVWYLLFLLSLLDCFIGPVVCLHVDFGVSAKFAKYLMRDAVVVVVVVVVFCSFLQCAALVVVVCVVLM